MGPAWLLLPSGIAFSPSLASSASKAFASMLVPLTTLTLEFPQKGRGSSLRVQGENVARTRLFWV